MLQYNRFGAGLQKYLPYITVHDQTKTSDSYFRLFDVPDRLYVGRNSFRIRANSGTLARGAMIYIDVVDSTGKIIYHEVTDFIGEDKSRVVVIHVYENTPPGEATIYIASRAKVDVRTGRQLPISNDPLSMDHIDYPNLMWTGKVVVIPTAQNDDEILFKAPPKVTAKERFEYYKVASNSTNRKKSVSGSMWLSPKLTLDSVVGTYQYSNDSRFATRYKEEGKNVILDPIDTGDVLQNNQVILPEYSSTSVVKAAAAVAVFSPSFIGSQLVFRNLTELLGLGVTVPDFSCSVVNILDGFRAEVSPSFKFVYEQAGQKKIISSIDSAFNVTASYYNANPELVTYDSESFVQLDFEELEPLAGSVESVRVSYKPYGSFGDFIRVGDFPITEQEYLVDSASLATSKTDLVEFPIGTFRTVVDFDKYWDRVSLAYNLLRGTGVNFPSEGVTLFNLGSAPASYTPKYHWKIQPKTQYAVRAVPGTEYKLSFTYWLYEIFDKTKPSVDHPAGQIDVYISGSNITRETIGDQTYPAPETDLTYGSLLGSIVADSPSQLKTTLIRTGNAVHVNMYFKVVDGDTIFPIILFKNIKRVELKNISIVPRNELGYSPNQAKLFIPLETLKTNTELVMNIEYLSGTGVKSKLSSTLYGLNFTGVGLQKTVLDEVLPESDVFTQYTSSVSGSLSSISSSLIDFKSEYTDFSSSITDYTSVSSSISFLNNKTLVSGSPQIDYTNVENIPIEVDGSNLVTTAGGYTLNQTLYKSIPGIAFPGATGSYYDLYEIAFISMQGVLDIDILFQGNGLGNNYRYQLPITYQMDWLSKYPLAESSPYGSTWRKIHPWVSTPRHMMPNESSAELQVRYDSVNPNKIRLRVKINEATQTTTAQIEAYVRHSHNFAGATVTELFTSGTDATSYDDFPIILGGTDGRIIVQSEVTASGFDGPLNWNNVTSVPVGIVSGSAQVKQLLPAGTVSGSAQVLFSGITGKPTLVSGSIQIDHDATFNFVANEHVDHTSVSVNAGLGMSGGGNISATRTLTLNTSSGHFVTGSRVAIKSSSFASRITALESSMALVTAIYPRAISINDNYISSDNHGTIVVRTNGGDVRYTLHPSPTPGDTINVVYLSQSFAGEKVFVSCSGVWDSALGGLKSSYLMTTAGQAVTMRYAYPIPDDPTEAWIVINKIT